MLGKIEGRRRGRQKMRWLYSITYLMDESEQTPGVVDGQGSLMCFSPRGRKGGSDTTEQLNRLTEARCLYFYILVNSLSQKLTLQFCKHSNNSHLNFLSIANPSAMPLNDLQFKICHSFSLELFNYLRITCQWLKSIHSLN